MNYQPVTVGNQSNHSAGVQEQFDAEKAREDDVQQYVLFPVWSFGSNNPQNTDRDAAFEKFECKFEDFSDNIINEVNAADSTILAIGQLSTNNTNTFSDADLSNAAVSPTHGKSSYIDTSQLPNDPNMLELEDITYSNDEEDVGVEADFTNLETTITEELLQFKMQKVWVLVDLPYGKRAIVARIEAIRLFLAYASFMGFMVYQMDVKSAFLYGTIEEEVYVCQPPGFKDPDYPNKIFVDDIIFGSTNKDLCKAFEKLMKDKFQMSSLGELTFFLGLQVKQRPYGIFIDQDKYVAKILRKFGLTDGKSASTLIDTEKPLLNDPDGEDVDVHTYRSMIGSLMYLTSSRPDIMFAVCLRALFQVTPKALHLHAVKRIFRYIKGKPHLVLWYPKDSPFNLVAYLDSDYVGASLYRKSTTSGCQFLGCRLISWQCKKQTIVATSSTEAEYVAAAKSIDCLPNEEISIELSRMGYEKPSTKLTFYKAFFSPQWKFLIHTKLLVRNVDSSTKFYMYLRFLQLMIRVQVSDLSSHTTKYSSPALTQKVFANMRRVGKGFFEVDTPLFEGMIVAHQADEGAAEVNVDDVPAAGVVDEGPASVAIDDDKITQTLEITKLKQRVKKLERRDKLKVSKLMRLKKVGTSQRVDTSDDTVMDDVSKQGRIIANMNADVDVTLKDVADIAKELAVDAEIEESACDDELEPTEHQEVVEVVTTTKLMTEVVTAASATIIAADSLIPAATITAAVPTFTTAPSAARRRKGVVIRDPKETATPSTIIYTEPKSKDKGKGILDDVIDQVQRKEKEDNAMMRYQALKRKPQTKAQARKNMMIYLRNMAGFKMDYFKGMKYVDIRLIFKKYFNFNVAFLEKTKEQMEEEDSRALKRANESQAEKAAKKQKLDEDVVELKRHLQIVPNDENDVYT
nr:hypothetical protein [Tanacetum cinerariifolium]